MPERGGVSSRPQKAPLMRGNTSCRQHRSAAAICHMPILISYSRQIVAAVRTIKRKKEESVSRVNSRIVPVCCTILTYVHNYVNIITVDYLLSCLLKLVKIYSFYSFFSILPVILILVNKRLSITTYTIENDLTVVSKWPNKLVFCTEAILGLSYTVLEEIRVSPKIMASLLSSGTLFQTLAVADSQLLFRHVRRPS